MANNEIKIILSAVDKASGNIKKVNTAFKDLTGVDIAAAASLAGVGLALKKAVDFTKQAISETVAYNKTIREMTQVTGLGADEISRIVQVGDDWGVSIEAIRTSLAFMNKSGVTPSIDNLAKMADEYVNSADKAAWAEKAVKTLGRGYQTLIPLLAQGGDSLREQAAAINDNLVATDESIRKSREYEVAVDDLADAWTGLKYAIGNAAIPTLTIIIKSFTDARTEEEKQVDVINQLKRAQKLGLVTMLDVNQANYDLYNGTKDVDEITQQYKGELDKLNQVESYNVQIEREEEIRRKAVTTTTLDSEAAQKLYNDAVETYSQRSPLYLQQYADFTQAQKDAELATEGASAAMDIINGAISKYSDSLTTTMELQAAFNLALGLITQAEYDQTVAIANSLKPLEAMAQLVEDGTLDISYLRQAMADGKVTTDELIAAYIAVGMTLDEATAKALGLTDALNNMPTRKKIDIDVEYHPGQVPPGAGGAPIPFQHGANFIVPPGYPNDSFRMGVESGEHVIVIPKNRVGSTTNNFTMNVHTNASSSRIISDFNMMKARAR